MKRLLLTSIALVTLVACGKKDPSPTPGASSAPTAAPATSGPSGTSDVTVPAEPAVPEVAEPPPAPTRKGFVAWAMNPDGELETALFLDGESTPLATRADTVVVAVGDQAFRLDRELSTMPLKPCEDDGQAVFVALGVTGVEPTYPKRVIGLSDPKLRPERDSSSIYAEKLDFATQVGPYLLMRHETNADTCPVPATGAIFDSWKVLDLSEASTDKAPELRDPRFLFEEAELVAMETKAKADGKVAIKKDYPDAEDAELERALELYEPIFNWSDEGQLTGTAIIEGESTAFSEVVDEEGAASVRVPLEAPASKLRAFATTPPAAVMAFWKQHRAEGRGFSPVSGQAFETLALWLGSK
jgi:hypothetical protein